MSSTEFNWQEDYRAFAKGAYIVLNDWSQVSLTGKDRHIFLHNMCTNDIRNLDHGQACEAYCTDVKGKIVGHVLVFAGQEMLTLLTVPGQAAQIIEHLDYYLIREDVQFCDDSHQFTWIVAIGREAEHVTAELSNPAAAEIQGATLPLVWPPHYLLRVRNEQRERTLAKFASQREVDQQSPAWQSLRIESQWPLFGVDFDRSALPQEVNRDERAIHLNKGCYLGQETIARIDALGHVNKKLTLVRFAGNEVPPPGTILHRNEQDVGRVTSSCWSPHFAAPLAFAWLRRGSNEVGCELHWSQGSAEVVAPVPFTD